MKFENIMLAKKNPMSLRIVDFGLSKMLGPNETSVEPFGTIFYTAPEIFLNKPYNKAVDMWSLGIIIYAMFTGFFPFSGENDEKTRKSIISVSDQPDYSDAVWKTSGKDCLSIVKGLLIKDPSKRMTLEDVLKHSALK